MSDLLLIILVAAVSLSGGFWIVYCAHKGES